MVFELLRPGPASFWILDMDLKEAQEEQFLENTVEENSDKKSNSDSFGYKKNLQKS